MIENNPTITKTAALELLKNDLNKLSTAFISNKDIKKKIDAMLSESMKPTSITTEFWEEHSETLKMLSRSNMVNENVIEHELKRKATENMCGSSSSTATTTPSEPTLKSNTGTIPYSCACLSK